ncbi:MAG: MFS transporter [Colwellia sp.]|nr:MFS transporter [Colwellia sp.]
MNKSYLSLLVMILLSFFLMIDTYITPAILAQLSAHYDIETYIFGWANALFLILGSIVGLFIGHYADKKGRKYIFVLVVFIGELACFLTGLTYFNSSIYYFFLFRILSGIGVGGVYPLIFSFVAECISQRHRAKMNAIIDIAWGLGMMAGPALATYCIANNLGWHTTFLYAALPSFPLLILFCFLYEDSFNTKKRQLVTKGNYKNIVFLNKTNLLIFLQGIPGSIPWGILPFWLILFLQQNKGLSSTNSLLVWESFGIAAVLGGFLWAFLGDKIYNYKPHLLLFTCSFFVFLGIVPSYILINSSHSELPLILLLTVLSGSCVAIAGPNIKAILMNSNCTNECNRVFSIYNLMDNIGKALGPAIGSLLLMYSYDLVTALNIGISFWLISALLLFICGLTFKAKA